MELKGEIIDTLCRATQEFNPDIVSNPFIFVNIIFCVEIKRLRHPVYMKQKRQNKFETYGCNTLAKVWTVYKCKSTLLNK